VKCSKNGCCVRSLIKEEDFMKFELMGKRFVAVLALGSALLFAGHSLLGQDAPAGGKKGAKAGGAMTMTGVVSDAMCSGNHNGKDAAKCTAGCVAKGSKYALVMDGGKSVTLEDAPADIAKLAGQKATVTGTMDGKDTMKVTKVEAAKS